MCGRARGSENFPEAFHYLDTPQIAYKVAVCPRENLLYIRIYFTNNTNILKGIATETLILMRR